ncbi:thiamine-phosphate pyrophosphorylase [Sphingomonas gellani]|uniref:Thiamine-phosphate pyrophosphorylase n=1 Tax=Sphingomonas gellani TaxID=1166340 RepID=A0A1H8HCY8_9SPHN|nr:thiamine phosphate synthase [Sphingomonas gellani]SEN54111.1 thiamine-phosphate pyrophosphorylase [Sphingomonas gellani]
MTHRKIIPRLWLMTDERVGEALWTALRRLPPGSGVVLRHHATAPAQRRALIKRVRRVAAARRLVLLVAGGASGVAGVHGAGHGTGHGLGLRSWSAHDRRQAIAARRTGADLVFVSPIFATRSHPAAMGVGPGRGRRIGTAAGLPLIALGGMDRRRWLRIRHLGFHGWAAIDALTSR